MPPAIALIVDPLGRSSEAEYRDARLLTVALAAFASIQESGGTLLLVSDATVAVSLAFAGLEARPPVPLERGELDEQSGATILHLLQSSAHSETDEQMYRAMLEGDGLVAAGLLSPIFDQSLPELLARFRPGAALVVTVPEAAPTTVEAMSVLERFAASSRCRLLVSDPHAARSGWTPVTEFLTPEQANLEFVPEPPEDRGEFASTLEGEEGTGSLLRFVEREAMEAARAAIAVERALAADIGGGADGG